MRAPAKVLATAANGYLAVWVVKKYLEAGYSVRGTLRPWLKAHSSESTINGDRFELVAIEDITKDGALTPTQSTTGTLHVHFTARLLIQTVRFFSRCTAYPRSQTGYMQSLSSLPCWDHIDPELRSEARKHCKALHPNLFCGRGPRALHDTAGFQRNKLEQRRHGGGKCEGLRGGAIRGVHGLKDSGGEGRGEFVAAHKSEISWDLVAIHPPYIFGPSLTPAPTIDDVNTSQREIYDTFSGARTSAELQNQANWVHMGVAAEAYVRATYAAPAGGERIIIRAGLFFYQDICELYIYFLLCIRGLDLTHKTSGCSGRTRDSECATWRTRLNGGHPWIHQI
ncbi:hypothetical protein BJV78DRAFT_390093 [Lactifluus subvellereus]|nr:hypothetical protein BJV78DRAFT_390093 [Lactifluus subvellereus]